MKTKDHYENHLHSYYSWIYGGTKTGITKNIEFFRANGIQPSSSKVAIDLGCGSGFQSIPLSDIGFEVKSVDFSRALLDELNEKIDGRNIEIIDADMTDFKSYAQYEPELIVCMGDTLTHLDNMKSVEKLIENAFNILQKDGKIILSFRDLTYELKDEKRFIPVRNDDDKIFMCFLEYFHDYVMVFDVVYEKQNDKWEQKISFYKKIKISKETIKSILQDSGFQIEYFDILNGMITAIGKK